MLSTVFHRRYRFALRLTDVKNGAIIRKVMSAWLFAVCALTSLALATQVASRDDDVERALDEARTRAAAGDVVAQFSLGAMHYYGDNDTAQGIEWFRKAAAQGYPPAEFQMGQLHDFGFGVAQDDGAALEWYGRAAEHGSAAAQRAVGDFHRKGRGIPADLAKAAAWYRRGADGDDIRAQNQLGEMYFTGTGVPLDYASAYFGTRWPPAKLRCWTTVKVCSSSGTSRPRG